MPCNFNAEDLRWQVVTSQYQLGRQRGYVIFSGKQRWKKLYWGGGGASAALTWLVSVDMASFLSQWRLRCGGQSCTEKQVGSEPCYRDVEIHLEVQQDGQKWLNQNSCPKQSMELEGTVVQATWSKDETPKHILEFPTDFYRVQVCLSEQGSSAEPWHQRPSLSTLLASALPPYR